MMHPPLGVPGQCCMMDLPMCLGALAPWAWLAVYPLIPYLATHYVKPYGCHVLSVKLDLVSAGVPWRPHQGGPAVLWRHAG